MTEKLKLALYALMGLGIFLFWLHSCHDPSVRATQKLADSTVVVNAHSHATDLRVSRMAAESSMLVSQLRRFARNDTVARRENVRLRARIRPVDSIPLTSPPDTFVAQLQLRDSVIDQLVIERDALDSSLTIWKALAVERGDLLQRALLERNSFRDIARAWQGKAGKRFGCAGGPAVVASIGGRVSAGVGVTCGIRF